MSVIEAGIQKTIDSQLLGRVAATFAVSRRRQGIDHSMMGRIRKRI